MSGGARTERIVATIEHPFWRVGTGWTGASDLAAGDALELADGREGRVVGVERLEEEAPVYNFAVDGFHTYYVGAGIWVQNASRLGDIGGSRVLTVEEAGANLAQQIWKNRVSVMTPSGRMQIDLAGKPHFEKSIGQEIPTPHVKFQEQTQLPMAERTSAPARQGRRRWMTLERLERLWSGGVTNGYHLEAVQLV